MLKNTLIRLKNQEKLEISYNQVFKIGRNLEINKLENLYNTFSADFLYEIKLFALVLLRFQNYYKSNIIIIAKTAKNLTFLHMKLCYFI